MPLRCVVMRLLSADPGAVADYFRTQPGPGMVEPGAMHDKPWSLLRIWHVEILDSWMGSPSPTLFTRTSYCVAPSELRARGQIELVGRVETLLAASYAMRNHQTAQSGDPAKQVCLAFAFEWVDE